MTDVHPTFTIDVVEQNRFSFVVPDATWIDHEWLYQVGLWMIYHWAGEHGLVIFQLVCAVLISCLLYRLQTRSHDNGLLALAGLVIPLIGLRYGFGLRPQIATYLGTAVVFLVCFTWDSDDLRFYGDIPLLILIWAQCHGGFFVGLVVFGSLIPYLMTNSCRTYPTRLGLIASFLGAVIVTLINPYGVELWQLVIQASANPFTRQFIVDWRPLISRPWLFLIGIVLLVQTGIWWSSHRDLKATLLLCPIAITAVMAFMSLRNLPLLAIAVGATCPWPSLSREGGGGLDLPGGPFVIGSLLIVGVIGLRLHGGLIVPDRYTPDKLVKPVLNHPAQPRVFAHYNWSQWLLFRDPGIAVYFDARYDTAYPHSVIRNYVRIVSGSVRLLNESGANWVMAPDWYPLNRRLEESPRWKRVRHTKSGQLWKRVPDIHPG